MKKYLFLALIIITASFSVDAQKRQTRNVGNFSKLNLRVPGTLYLKQGNETKVELEGSEKILAEIETNVEGSKLVIEFEDKWDNWDNDEKIKIYVTMATVEGLSVSGSGSIISEGKIKTADLDLNVSGSGNLKLEADASGTIDANVSGSGDLEYKGSMNAIDSDVSGSGKIILSSAIKEEADFSVSGSGEINAAGSAKNVKVSLSGSGKVLASGLEADSSDIKISGSGKVEVNVKESLDANISGSGTVNYKGNPSKVNSHSSGSGKVSKM